MARKKVTVLNADKSVKLSEEGSVTGYYLGFRTIPSSNGMKESLLHIFQTDTGNLGVWGFYNLNIQLASVKAGTMTFVDYAGRSTVKVKDKQPMHLANVEIDDELSIDVSTVEGSGASNEPESSEEVNESYEESSMEEVEEPKVASKPLVRGNTSVTAEQQARAMANLKGRSKTA